MPSEKELYSEGNGIYSKMGKSKLLKYMTAYLLLELFTLFPGLASGQNQNRYKTVSFSKEYTTENPIKKFFGMKYKEDKELSVTVKGPKRINPDGVDTLYVTAEGEPYQWVSLVIGGNDKALDIDQEGIEAYRGFGDKWEDKNTIKLHPLEYIAGEEEYYEPIVNLLDIISEKDIAGSVSKYIPSWASDSQNETSDILILQPGASDIIPNGARWVIPIKLRNNADVNFAAYSKPFGYDNVIDVSGNMQLEDGGSGLAGVDARQLYVKSVREVTNEEYNNLMGSKDLGPGIWAIKPRMVNDDIYKVKDNDIVVIKDSKEINLTKTPNIGEYEGEIFPEKNKIAYLGYDKNNNEFKIFVSDLDFKQPRLVFTKKVTNDVREDILKYPMWLEGDKIIINNSLLVDINNSSITDLKKLNIEGFITRSPDFKKMYYSYGNDIWVIDYNLTNQKNLTNTEVTELYPSISPDGEKILFLVNDFLTKHIGVMNSDGSGRKILIDDLEKRFTGNGLKEWFVGVWWSKDADKMFLGYQGGKDERGQLRGLYQKLVELEAKESGEQFPYPPSDWVEDDIYRDFDGYKYYYDYKAGELKGKKGVISALVDALNDAKLFLDLLSEKDLSYFTQMASKRGVRLKDYADDFLINKLSPGHGVHSAYLWHRIDKLEYNSEDARVHVDVVEYKEVNKEGQEYIVKFYFHLIKEDNKWKLDISKSKF